MIYFFKPSSFYAPTNSKKLIVVNLSCLFAYVVLRMIFPFVPETHCILSAVFAVAALYLFSVNLILLVAHVLPRLLTLKDKYGQAFNIDHADEKLLPRIIFSYIFTLVFGYLFLVELMQFAASFDLFNCGAESCDAKQMGLATEVITGSVYGGTEISANNVLGMLVLLIGTILNIVMVTLLIPILLAFRSSD